MASMIQRHRGRWVALLVGLALAGCHSASTPTNTSAVPATKPAAALFYAKDGSLYVSEPAGTPGRKLTDGPADSQPAPSPNQSQVAFVRKTKPADYGGELWVLDLSPLLEPAGPLRRLVDPAALSHRSGGMTPMVASPRWSPSGQQLAFVANPTGGAVDGGVLLVVAADTGALIPRQHPPEAEWAPFAESNFSWAPDGSHLAWLNERSDVRPVDVNVLAAGGTSAPVATGTNASNVTYARDGQSILFANNDATDPVMLPNNPFDIRIGGVYSVAASADIGAKPTAATALFTRPGWHFDDVAALDSGALAFTTHAAQRGTAGPSKSIQVLDSGSSLPRTTITGIAAAAQGPAWGTGDLVAYLDASPQRGLVVTDLDNRKPRQVDTGVDSFAWAPRHP